MVCTAARVASMVTASSGRLSVLTIHCAIAIMSSSPMPRVVQAGVPSRTPAGAQRRARIVGDHLLVGGDADRGRAPPRAARPSMPKLSTVSITIMWLSVPPVTRLDALGHQRRGQRLGVAP